MQLTSIKKCINKAEAENKLHNIGYCVYNPSSTYAIFSYVCTFLSKHPTVALDTNITASYDHLIIHL